jgi:nucleoside-diphosphate-sugar epimerase
MPDRGWDTQVWVSDNRKIRQALGWEPRHTFEAGFRQFVAWLQDNPSPRAYYEERVGPP